MYNSQQSSPALDAKNIDGREEKENENENADKGRLTKKRERGEKGMGKSHWDDLELLTKTPRNV